MSTANIVPDDVIDNLVSRSRTANECSYKPSVIPTELFFGTDEFAVGMFKRFCDRFDPKRPGTHGSQPKSMRARAPGMLELDFWWTPKGGETANSRCPGQMMMAKAGRRQKNSHNKAQVGPVNSYRTTTGEYGSLLPEVKKHHIERTGHHKDFDAGTEPTIDQILSQKDTFITSPLAGKRGVKPQWGKQDQRYPRSHGGKVKCLEILDNLKGDSGVFGGYRDVQL
ncbi:hypothetical protein FQN57_003899 [Myotisia sp. PD_48]|nr:hypothetical protein FQN57_003899 [Myotisia sp. PD_48]